jgi:ribonuclease R
MSSRRRRKQGGQRKQDPFAEREARKYDRPIPSREYILDALASQGAPVSFDQLADYLHLPDDHDRESLRRRLNAMERDGQLIRNRKNAYLLIDKSDLVRGRVVGHADGFGFLVSDEGGDDLFLSPREMQSLFHEDVIVARVAGVDYRGRREAAVVEILERNTQRVTGRYFREGGVGFVTPDNKRISQSISIPAEYSDKARNGQIVTAEIVEQPTRRTPPIGRVTEVLGAHMAPGMEIDVAIRVHELPLAWPPSVEEEIAGLSEHVPSAAKRGREDLRHLPLVTIDGEDARDFDDAVYCEKTPKGWRLLVAIADVSHYVRPGTALDEEAQQRGNSVYFPERVIPMLPEILSNGLCSLNPEVDRLCMVCEMYITHDGKLIRSRFIEGLMHSHARLTYEEVAAMLVNDDKHMRKRFASLVPHLEELYRLYKLLLRARVKRGAIDFDTTETRIVFGADRKIERIVPVQRNDAHRLIEECMISANVASARYLTRQKLPTLFRIHDGPKADKLTDLREFLGELGLGLRGGEKPQARDFANLLKRVQGRPDAHLIQTVMLRSLTQAVYHPDNIGHFGLALDEYLHYTSPIRRYPDLVVHRAIRHVLATRRQKEGANRERAGQGRPKAFRYTAADMAVLGEHCSMTERRADEATRDAVNWLKCEYMMDKVGDTFSGIVSSVTSFGIFVELENIYVEGLVHVTALKNDYYHFEPAVHRLIGERSGTVYRLGDSVQVKVVRVDLDERKIDFDLVESGGRQDRRVARGPGTSKKSRHSGRKRTARRRVR